MYHDFSQANSIFDKINRSLSEGKRLTDRLTDTVTVGKTKNFEPQRTRGNVLRCRRTQREEGETQLLTFAFSASFAVFSFLCGSLFMMLWLAPHRRLFINKKGCLKTFQTALVFTKPR
jgi:hypothetical protein